MRGWGSVRGWGGVGWGNGEKVTPNTAVNIWIVGGGGAGA